MNFLSPAARRAVAATALGCALLGLPSHAQLPSLGETGDLSTAAERKIGDRIAFVVADTPEEAIKLLDEAAAGATQGMVW